MGKPSKLITLGTDLVLVDNDGTRHLSHRGIGGVWHFTNPPTPISSVWVNVDTPVYGRRARIAYIGIASEIVTGSASWSPLPAGVNWASSTVYTVTVTIKAKTGYVWTSGTQCFINNFRATVVSITNDTVVCRYTFPKTEAAQPPGPPPGTWRYFLDGSPLGWTTYSDGGGSHSAGAIDVPASYKTLKSPCYGTIIYAAWENGGGGNVVIVRPDGETNGIVFAHLSEIRVKVGDRVSPGSTLGVTGSTGASSGPHVHVEIRTNGIQWGPWVPAVNYFKRRGVDVGPRL